jgi:hypothetical protein
VGDEAGSESAVEAGDFCLGVGGKSRSGYPQLDIQYQCFQCKVLYVCEGLVDAVEQKRWGYAIKTGIAQPCASITSYLDYIILLSGCEEPV